MSLKSDKKLALQIIDRLGLEAADVDRYSASVGEQIVDFLCYNRPQGPNAGTVYKWSPDALPAMNVTAVGPHPGNSAVWWVQLPIQTDVTGKDRIELVKVSQLDVEAADQRPPWTWSDGTTTEDDDPDEGYCALCGALH